MKIGIFLMLVLISSLCFADTAILQSANGNAISSSNPLQVTIAGGNINAAAGWTTDGSTKTTTPYNVGVGSNIATNTLTISGNGSIGAGYISNSAPANGLIVQGNTGINSLSPGQQLDVVGNIRSVGNVFSTTNIGIGTIAIIGTTEALDITGGGVRIAGPRQTNSGMCGIFDYFGGGTRLIVQGTSNSTRGTFNLGTRNLDTTGFQQPITTDTSGNLLLVQDGGNVGIGSITPGVKLDVFGGTIRVSTLASDAGATDSTVCNRSSDGLFLKGSGTIGICLGTSTKEAKKNIEAIEAGLAEIMQLKPIMFYYRAGWGYPIDKPYYGFLAEDVETVLPKLVGHDESGKVKNADYMGMIPVIVKAVQEIDQRNNLQLMFDVVATVLIVFILMKVLK